MSSLDADLETLQLSQSIDHLIRCYQNLKKEKAELHKAYQCLQAERDDLIEKNNTAREKIERMIEQLKTVEDA